MSKVNFKNPNEIVESCIIKGRSQNWVKIFTMFFYYLYTSIFTRRHLGHTQLIFFSLEPFWKSRGDGQIKKIMINCKFTWSAWHTKCMINHAIRENYYYVMNIFAKK